MSQRTAEFYKIILKYEQTKQKVDYHNLKEILNNIIDNYGVTNEKITTIDLDPNISPGEFESKMVLDIFPTTENNYLFGRVCKQKSKSGMIKRDYLTYIPDEVFTPEVAAKQGIEVFSYFLLDYSSGIMVSATSNQVSTKRGLDEIIQHYAPTYELEFIAIPNSDGIQLLYDAGSPQLYRIEFDCPRPSSEYLQQMFGLDETQLLYLASADIDSMQITLKAKRAHPLTRKPKNVRGILDFLRKMKNMNDIKVRGKSERFNATEFSFYSQYYTYPIDVVKYKILNGTRAECSLDELTENFEIALKLAYTNSYNQVRALAGRDGDDE